MLKTRQKVTILINNKAIEVEEVKYLGIIIDSKLTFKNHINELKKKISRSIGVLYKLRPFVTSKILSSVYYTIIYPFLLYGITIWGNAGKNLLTPILTLQNKFVRMATYNDSLPESPGALVKALPLFHRLKILTIFDIYNLQVGKLVFETINEIGPTQSIIEFTLASDIHQHNTRYENHSNFYSKGVRTTQVGLKNLINEGSKLWATIPNNIKNCPSRISFNECYKEFMIDSYQ